VTAHELLNLPNKRIIKGSISGEDLAQDLKELLPIYDDANDCDKIRGALKWATICDGEEQCASWGGCDQVKAFLTRDRNGRGDRCEVAEMLARANTPALGVLPNGRRSTDRCVGAARRRREDIFIEFAGFASTTREG